MEEWAREEKGRSGHVKGVDDDATTVKTATSTSTSSATSTSGSSCGEEGGIFDKMRKTFFHNEGEKEKDKK
jgi:hypothetical protein